MRRGDIVTIAVQGDYGKPRPAIVVQSDRLSETGSVLVCPMTTTPVEASLSRLMLPPTQETGLKAPSYAMAEKLIVVPRRKCGPVIGQLPSDLLPVLNDMLAFVLGLAD